MLKSFTVYNQMNLSKTIELRRPEKSGLLVRKIDGLDPPRASIAIKNASSMDGGLFNNAKLSTRNIVITMDILAKPTVEDVRLECYKFFIVKNKIKLLFETDNRICEIEGYVESIDVNIFSKNEQIKVSIVCPDPYLYDKDFSFTTFYGIDPAFEFPFSNESLLEPLIEFGIINEKQTDTVFYEGDGEIGFIIKIKTIGNVKNITIYDYYTRDTFRIKTDIIEKLTGNSLKDGDEIIISTVRNNKYVYLLRDGIYTNIINSIDKNSKWFTIKKGDNIFTFIADEGVNNIQFRIEYKNAYEGV